MQWVKNKELLLSTNIAIQIDSTISDGYLEAGKTGISI